MSNTQLEQVLAKRKQAQEIMSKLGVPAWVVIVADNEAEKAHLPLIGAPTGASHRAYVLTPDRAVAVAHDVEAAVQERYCFETIRMEGRNAIGPLARNLAKIVGQGVTPIALNYSTRFSNVDTLGLGSFEQLVLELEKNNYFPEGLKGDRFMPADELIFTVASTKLPYEIDLLREAAQVTNKVLVETFKDIKPGMTEKQVADLVHKIADEKISGNKRLGYSWQKEFNPVVLTGEGIAGSPHEAPSERVIEPGATVYIDFGLSVDGYHGDLQHFGYVLKKGEQSAPEQVQQMLCLLTDSIEAGMKAAKPGALGWEVDKASRDVIIRAGHPSYKHGTGHQLGSGGVHAPGVLFAAKYEGEINKDPGDGSLDLFPYSQLPLGEGYVLTIEPRIQIANGASIEVDGVVTVNGFELFVPIQKEIHLIR